MATPTYRRHLFCSLFFLFLTLVLSQTCSLVDHFYTLSCFLFIPGEDGGEVPRTNSGTGTSNARIQYQLFEERGTRYKKECCTIHRWGSPADFTMLLKVPALLSIERV